MKFFASCMRLFCPGPVFARVLMLLAAVFPFACQSQASDTVTHPWLADHQAAHHIDADTFIISASLPQPGEVVDVAADPHGGVWVLTRQRLSHYEAGGVRLFEVDLPQLATDANMPLSQPQSLALNPYDGSLWLAGVKAVLHLAQGGQVLGQYQSQGPVRALALALDETLWLIAGQELIQLAAGGKPLARQKLATTVSARTSLAVDSLARRAWVAGPQGLHYYLLDHLAAAPQSIALPLPRPAVSALALELLTGQLWLAAGGRLLAYDRLGQATQNLQLATLGLHEVEALAPVTPGGGLWLSGHKAVWRLNAAGEAQGTLSLEQEIEALDNGSLSLLPSLKWLAPPEGVYTNNPYTSIELGLGAICNAAPCDAGQAYLNDIQLDVDLNGVAIGGRFARQGAQARYTPSARLPEGANLLSAQARDRFGHYSNPVGGQFYIDTLAPAFISLTPADGSTLSQPGVTLTGEVADASSVHVILQDSAGNTLGLSSGAAFSFAVDLAPGANGFTLTARDAAGNETTLGLTLYLSSLALTLTDPTDGAVIEADSVAVRGTFTGPGNTGIAVNGVSASTVGEHFAAVVALKQGENTIAASATTADGQNLTQSITVTITGGSVDFEVERLPATVASAIISTVAGQGRPGYGGDGGPASEAYLAYPQGLAVGPDGSLYIADTENRRIRRIAPDGIIKTVAGSGWPGDSGDGGPATQARFNYPTAVALGPSGNLYIADTDSHRVRRVRPDGVIETVAGTGQPGYSGDGGPGAEARLYRPRGLAVAADGSLYIADYYNHRIRRLGPNGVITTVAGSRWRGFYGDGGPATQARLNYPTAVALSPEGELYIADYSNYRIRRVSADGVISTYAVARGEDLKRGADGSLYLPQGHQVMKIGPDGHIAPVAGNGSPGYSGDGGPPLAASLYYPLGLALDNNDQLYIADTLNHRIRRMETLNLPGGHLAPLPVAFQIDYFGEAGVQNIEADFDGDGVVDYTTTDAGATLNHLYRQPGLYPARFTVTDANGQRQSKTLLVAVLDAGEMDTLFTGIWNGLNQALIQGDIDRAAVYLNTSAKQKYQPVFQALLPHFPDIVGSYSALQRIAVTENIGEYAINRTISGRNKLFLIYFLKDIDGVWRLDTM